jgi:molecular chaperone HscA
LKEAQVEAQRLIEAVQSALKSDGELLSAEQLAKIEASIASLQATALGENRRHITLAMDDLEAETKDFAARRMNKSIRNAFAGKRIDELEKIGDSAKGKEGCA